MSIKHYIQRLQRKSRGRSSSASFSSSDSSLVASTAATDNLTKIKYKIIKLKYSLRTKVLKIKRGSLKNLAKIEFNMNIKMMKM